MNLYDEKIKPLADLCWELHVLGKEALKVRDTYFPDEKGIDSYWYKRHPGFDHYDIVNSAITETFEGYLAEEMKQQHNLDLIPNSRLFNDGPAFECVSKNLGINYSVQMPAYEWCLSKEDEVFFYGFPIIVRTSFPVSEDSCEKACSLFENINYSGPKGEVTSGEGVWDFPIFAFDKWTEFSALSPEFEKFGSLGAYLCTFKGQASDISLTFKTSKDPVPIRMVEANYWHMLGKTPLSEYQSWIDHFVDGVHLLKE